MLKVCNSEVVEISSVKVHLEYYKRGLKSEKRVAPPTAGLVAS